MHVLLCGSRPRIAYGAIRWTCCLTVRGHCAPGLVAGRYQPLADDVTIAGDVRPNLSSAVESEDKGNRTWVEIRFPPPSAKVQHLLPEIVGLCPRFPGNQLAHYHSA
jgi:hypothetical protein